MKIAIAMYKRMGFEFQREIAPVYGMAAELYLLNAVSAVTTGALARL
jgi:ribosomal protein S18 acetylase RimI-like enzyme